MEVSGSQQTPSSVMLPDLHAPDAASESGYAHGLQQSSTRPGAEHRQVEQSLVSAHPYQEQGDPTKHY